VTVRRLAVPLAALLLLAGCSSGVDGDAARRADAADPAVSTSRFPGAEWEVADPTEHGLDPAALEATDRLYAEADSNCIAVVRDGFLVHEEYWQGYEPSTAQEVFSASKSVTSLLVGIAQDQGLLDIDDRASEYLTEWRGTPSESVTIRNLLSNDSGRHYDFVTDYLVMATRERDKSAFSIGLDQQHPPGRLWVYNNSAIQTLEEVLQRATGQDLGAFAQEHLFGPIGMQAEIAEDAAGNPLTFMGTRTTCRDLARFGWLALNEGRWAGEQVVSADYVREATSPSQDLNTVYGLLWWVNGDGRRLVDITGGSTQVVDDGSMFWPDAPEDAYAALGLGGQYVLVVPSENLVVTRLGGTGASPSPNDVLAAVLG
jgi:CubicO group peptidase (beta-lactamase class C family)